MNREEEEEVTEELHKESGEEDGRDSDVEKLTNSDLDESPNEEKEQDGFSIDEQLEQTAERNNLSVLNVKSIIHHVLKDKRVLAMAKKRAEEEVLSDCDEDDVYEPKLTRSRVRQAVASSVVQGTLTPEKLSSITRRSVLLSPIKTTPTKQVSSCLLESTFSEESSDDEYNPNHEVTKDSEGFTSEFDDEDKGLEEEEEETEVESDNDDDVMSSGDNDDEKTPSKAVTPPSPFLTLLQQNKPVGTVASTTEQSPSSTGVDHMAPCSTTTIETSVCTQPVCTYQMPPSSEPASVAACTATVETAAHIDLPPNSCTVVGDASDETAQECSLENHVFSSCSTNDVCQSKGDELPSGFSAEYEEQVMQEAASLLASLSDTLLSPQRPSIDPSCQNGAHLQQSSFCSNAEGDVGDIARRTRSKFPLTDTDITTIEASFQPPDLPTEDISMSGVELELDEDDRQWQQWLSELMQPTAPPQPEEVEEQDDDTEYNFWEDKPVNEKEEFRNDRGVRIPQKEVADLIEELLNPNNGVFTDTTTFATTPSKAVEDVTNVNLPGGMDLTSAYLLNCLGLHPPVLTPSLSFGTNTPLANEKDTGNMAAAMEGVAGPGNESFSMATSEEGSTGYLSKTQTLQLWDQIQQHFQLLMQTFVLTRFEPSLVFLSQIAVQAIEEILRWSADAEQGRTGSVWYIPGKEESRQLIEKLNPHCSDAVELVPATGSPPKIPDPVQDILMNNGIFWQYPQLLPEIGFAPLETARNSGHKYFTTEEDHLLVMGMDHYGSSSWKLIQENLLPTKTPHQLHLRVKNLCSRRTKGDNVVKYYKRTNQVKVPFKSQDTSKDSQFVDGPIPITLPSWVLTYHKKRAEKEKGNQLEDLNRIANLYKNVTTAVHQAPPIIPTSSDGGSSNVAGSKRNLSEQLMAAEANVKKARLSHEEDTTVPSKNSKALGGKKCISHGRRGGSRKGGGGGRRQKKTPLTSPTGVGDSRWQESVVASSQADMTQLLFMAGLEGSDPAARYAYNYLTEVKVSLMDCPGLYDKFLQVLTDARRQGWKPGKIYRKVGVLLHDWPHLMKLFTEFLKPGDTTDSKLLEDKMDLQQVKSFVSKLEKRYESSPQQMEQAFSVMTQLSMENSSSSHFTKKVLDTLTPLLKTHRDLLDDIRCFLDGLTEPDLFCDEPYEHIILGNGDVDKLDRFEEWRMPEDIPLAPRQAQEKSKAVEPKIVEHRNSVLQGTSVHKPAETGVTFARQTSSKSLSSSAAVFGTGLNRKEGREPERADSRQERTATTASHAGSCIGGVVGLSSPCSQPSRPVHSAAVTTSTGFEGGVTFIGDSVSSTDQSKESGCCLVTLDTSGRGAVEGSITSRQWTRVEDRAILQECRGKAVSYTVFSLVATRINRTPSEVESRFKQLLSLLQSLDT